MKHNFIRRTALLALMAMTAQFLSAQVTVAQWNGYTSGNPPENGKFLTTEGTALNSTAVLERDATVVQSSDYAVNSDKLAASKFWNNTVSDGGAEKYWIATFSTTGYKDLTISTRHLGSNTGPRDFKMQYRVGSGAWNDVSGFEDIVVLSSTPPAVYTTYTDMPLPSEMENQNAVSLRWLRTSTASVNGGTVASGGFNRLDVVVKGTVMPGFPQIITSTGNLKFFTKNQERTFTVTGDGLTNDITIVSSNPSAFVVDPASSTLPFDATDKPVTVMFTGSANATATLELKHNGVTLNIIGLTANYMASGNDGTEEKPFTIAECRKAQDAANYYWVQGYIVGVSDGEATFTPKFTAPFAVGTNLLLAADPDDTAEEDMLPVQLLTAAGGGTPAQVLVSTEINLRDNPANLGRYVKIEGTPEPYFGRPGLKNSRAYVFTTPPVVAVKNIRSAATSVHCSGGVLHVENLNEPATIQVYGITGNLVVATEETKIPLKEGIYIVKINAQVFKVINN